MRRMNNVTSPEQIDTEERASRVEMNPMLNGTSIPGQPSAAFLESLRKARSSSTWQDARIMSSSTSTDIRSPGPKTKFAIIAFLLTGLGLLISGGTIYWSGDYGEDQRRHGLDLLACSAIPLLPGFYGVFMWVAAANGWQGYSRMSVSYD